MDVYAKYLVVVLFFLGVPWTSDAQRSPEFARLMVEKLDRSKALLEGIATSDFRKIGASAEGLIQVSKTAEWFVHKTARYDLHSNEFRRAAEAISLKAAEKNIDGVTLAYFDLTMSCVRCHQHLREIRDARAPRPQPSVRVASH